MPLEHVRRRMKDRQKGEMEGGVGWEFGCVGCESWASE